MNELLAQRIQQLVQRIPDDVLNNEDISSMALLSIGLFLEEEGYPCVIRKVSIQVGSTVFLNSQLTTSWTTVRKGASLGCGEDFIMLQGLMDWSQMEQRLLKEGPEEREVRVVLEPGEEPCSVFVDSIRGEEKAMGIIMRVHSALVLGELEPIETPVRKRPGARL